METVLIIFKLMFQVGPILKRWYRFGKIKLHAPSAEIPKLQIALSQEDYDKLPHELKEDDVLFYVNPKK